MKIFSTEGPNAGLPLFLEPSYLWFSLLLNIVSKEEGGEGNWKSGQRETACP